MRPGILIGVLAAVVVALGVALAIVIAGDDSDESKTVVSTATTRSTVTQKTTTTPTTTGTNTTQGTSTTPATNVVRLEMFRLPSGNIGCGLFGGARCDIRQRSWSPPPRPANCDVDWGQGIQVGRSGAASFVCAGDTANDPSAPVLAYGEDSRVGRFSCASRRDGVTCTNRSTGHGFFLNRERYRLF